MSDMFDVNSLGGKLIDNQNIIKQLANTKIMTFDEYAQNLKPSGNIDLGETESIKEYSFYKKPVVSVVGKKVTFVDKFAFRKCSTLESVSFPLVKILAQYPFQDCTNLKNILLDSIVSINTYGLGSLPSLEIIDFPKSLKRIKTAAFSNCTSLKTMVLRSIDVVELEKTNAFVKTPFVGNDGKTADLYVPSALVEQYKTTTNWSEILSNGFTTIHAIEGSEYEKE